MCQRSLLGAHRLYLRKAEVVDVPAPTRCALLLPDTGETVADVHEARRNLLPTCPAQR